MSNVEATAPVLRTAPSDSRRVLPTSMPGARVAALVGSLVFAIAWTLILGKDVHWDAINYHLYLGYSAIHDRFATDFFAAGPPSYINPYAYVPLYLMSAAGWHAALMATVFAAWHGLALWLTFEITCAATMPEHGRSQAAFGLLAIAFAAMNPVLLQGIGSTMTDLSTGVFVLAGWWCIVLAVRDGRSSLAFVAGALCGAAAALKLSNAVFAIAAVPALFLFPGDFVARAKAVVAFSFLCGLALVIASLPWAWHLWQEFRNPLFPFLNHLFQSPDFTVEPLRYERFIPPDINAFLARPFEMLSPVSHIHTEPRAPDLRYFALIIVLLAWRFACRNAPPGAEHPHEPGRDGRAGSRRATGALLVGLIVAWCTWLAISGNSRYFIPMACIAAALLAIFLQRLHARWKDATALVIVIICGLQAVQFAVATDWRRDGGDWEGPWLRVEVPEKLRREPHFYLSAGFLTGSAFLPYVHRDSGMMNIGGFNIIAPGYAGADRAQALIDRNAGRLRLLAPLPAGAVDRASLPGPPEQLRTYVRRLGLRIDGSECEFLRIQGNLRAERRPQDGEEWKSFVACRLVKDPEERLAYERTVWAVDAVFDRVEDTCPNLFHPRRPPTQEHIYIARTYHMGSEMQLFVDEGRVKYYYPLRGGDPIDIGTLESWRKAPQPIDCSRRTKPAIVRFDK